MKRSEVTLTLLRARIARTDEARIAHLLVGIYSLLCAIADDMDIFENEDEEQ